MHPAEDPPLSPLQLHVHGPPPDIPEKFPALQRFTDGADEKLPPLELPQEPLMGGELVKQEAADPPEEPMQVHDHGPPPDKPEKVPELQKFEVGAVMAPVPDEDPQVPLTGSEEDEQETVFPPKIPLHFQFQGPIPVTDEGFPLEHKFVVGAVAVDPPAAEPQTPAIGPWTTHILVK